MTKRQLPWLNLIEEGNTIPIEFTLKGRSKEVEIKKILALAQFN